MENRKVKNATPLEWKGVKFKSKLEVNIFKLFEKNGLKTLYEPKKFVLQEGFKPTVEFWNRSKSKGFCPEMGKVREITYCPDFIVESGGKSYAIEAKGFENDAFPIKKKMFRAFLERTHALAGYYEVRSQAEALQVINRIKQQN